MRELDLGEHGGRRLLEALRRRLKSKKGAMGRVAEELGIGPSALSHALANPERMSVGRLYKILALLGEEPQSWVHRSTAKLDVPRLLGRQPWSRPPNLIREVRGTALALPDATPAQALPVPELLGLAVRLRQGPLRERLAWVRGFQETGEVLSAAAALEQYRQESPSEAERLARALAVEVCPRLEEGANQAFCSASGVLASACRMQGDLPIAASLLRLVIPRAQSLGNVSLIAELYQRGSYVLANRTQNTEALRVADAAADLFRSLGDNVGLARVRVDRGIFLLAIGRAVEAATQLEQALESLPAEAKLSRMAAHYHLGEAFQCQGLHQAAAGAFSAAEYLLLPSQAYNRASLLRARGSSLAAAKDVDSAVEAYRQARDLYRTINPFNQATVTLDLVELLLAAERPTEAAVEARSMASLLVPFASISRVAEAAARTLVRTSAAVSLVEVERARRELARARYRVAGPEPSG